MQTSQFSKSDPDCIEGVIKKDHRLNAIRKKINLIQLASEILAQVLPNDLLQHCFVANIHHGTITLSAESAAWSTHLRYSHQTILQALQNSSDFRHIQHIRLRLAKPRPRKTRPERTLSMSKQASETVLATANSVTNPKLKEALLRLAKHGEKN